MSEELRKDDESESIRVLAGLDSIRVRPKMFVGDVEQQGVNKVLQEACCLALDNAGHSCASEVHITISADGTATIFDDGPGLDPKPTKFGQSTIEVILSKLHACRNLKTREACFEELCDIGIVCSNALSEFLTYETSLAGSVWRICFERGILADELAIVGEDEKQWQRVTLKPDPEIFGDYRFSPELFVNWFRQLSIDFGAARIALSDEQTGTTTVLNE